MIEKFKHVIRNKKTTILAFGIGIIVVFTLTIVQQWLLLAGFIHAMILLSSFVFALTQYKAGWGHKVLATFLLIWSDLVFTALILSLFNRLNSLPLYAVLSCSLAIVSGLAIHILLGKRQAVTDRVAFPASNEEPFRFSPLVNFALFFLIIAIIGSLLIAVFYYPTNGDSISYRLPRAFFYVGKGNLSHPAENIDYRTLYYPFNGILAYIPNVLYQLDARSFNGLSFISWMLCGLGVYLFGRDLGASKTGSYLAACIYMSAPIVMVLATSTNDDSIAAAPLMMGLLFLYRWWHSDELLEVMLGGIGAGLSVGTKIHIAFFAPLIIIATVILLFKLYRQGEVKQFIQQRLLSLIIAGMLALALAAPFAVINFHESGHLYVPPNYIASAMNSPFNLKNAVEAGSIQTSQLFLSPIPDLAINNAAARRQVYAGFNTFIDHTLFFWIRPENNFASTYHKYQGIADPNGGFSEYNVWLGFSPIIILLGILALFASRKYTFSFPVWLLLSFFIWHFTYTMIEKFAYNISTYYTFPLTICAAGLAVVWDMQSHLKKQMAGLIKSAFVIVIFTNAVFIINILNFNVMRNLPALFRSGFSPAIPFVSEEAARVLKKSSDINIVRTHWATMYLDIMSQNTAANYSTSSMVPKTDSSVLNILTYQTAGRWGNIFIQVKENQKEYLTLLGFTQDPWSTELVFGKGNNTHLADLNNSGYIVYMGRLEMDQDLIKGDYLCPPYELPPGRVHPLGFDAQDMEQVEQRVQQIMPDGKVLLIRDWEQVRGCDYYPLAVPANSGHLNVQIRFKSEPSIISEGFLPLRSNQEYRFLSNPALTTSWLEMYNKIGIYDIPDANFISIDPVLSDTIWLDPTPEYLHYPPAGIHLGQNNNPALWLGQGTDAGLAGTIWATQAQDVEFRYEIEPTANTETDQRTIGFELGNADGTLMGHKQFNGTTQIVIRGNLTPGPNQFQLAFLDTLAKPAPVSGSTYPPLGIVRNFKITTQDTPLGSQFLPLLPPMQAGPLHAPLITMDESFRGMLNVSPTMQTPSTWGIEFTDTESWLWLGHGETNGVGFTLNSLSPVPQKVRLELRVLRGPANENNQRTLELTIENAKGTKVERLQFIKDLYKETTLSYNVDLAPGSNKIDLKVLEEATVSLLPQDVRPLLVRLLRITVLPIEK